MKYKIEQWDKKKKIWFEIGESSSAILALNIVRDVKNKFNKDFFRIITILDIF